MKTFLKKQQGFTLIELMIVIAIISILASIAFPIYKDRMIDARWAKTLTVVRALKLAVENCLSDNAGAFGQCDSLDPSGDGDIVSQGLSQYSSANGDFLKIKLISGTASIEITGDKPLADCILTIKPDFSRQIGMITWRYIMASGSSVADVNKCMSYVKGSTAS